MSERIEVGDLVMVVKPSPCGCINALGYVGVVSRIYPVIKNHCITCGDVRQRDIVAKLRDGTCEVSRLKKINPPAQDESIETSKEITV